MSTDSSWQYWANSIDPFIDFKDLRLSLRFTQILSTLGKRHFPTIPQAFKDPYQAKALYRFVDNKKVNHELITKGFGKHTAHECKGQKRVFISHDTTGLNYSGLKETEGLGPTNDKDNALGLHVHSSIAITEENLTKGLVAQKIWARDPKVRTKKNRAQRPIEQKESFKWLDGIRKSYKAFDALPKKARPELIHLLDSEGDIREVLYEVATLGDNAVIRCFQKRLIEGEVRYAHEAVARQPSLGTMEVKVPRSKGKKARTATVELRATKITLPEVPKKGEAGQRLEATLVELREVGVPEREECLQWKLWTFEDVTTFAQARKVCEWYLKRWRIEEAHLVLKSGCRTEKLQFDHVEDLKIMIAIYMNIALRIVRLRDGVKYTPEQACTSEFDDEEWRVLYIWRYKKAPPKDHPPPTMRELVLMIGRLGGHLGRKGDGMPGVRTLWRGMYEFEFLLEGFRLARSMGQ